LRLEAKEAVVRNTTLGLVVGLAVGFAGAFGGFGAFLVVLVCGALGLVAGRALDGELDLREIADVVGGRSRRPR
jgi:hypothetical protein